MMCCVDETKSSKICVTSISLTIYCWFNQLIFFYCFYCNSTIKCKGKILITFSSSLRLAGDTSECLRTSGLLGGANALPRPTACTVPWQFNLASLCLLVRASISGISSIESVDSCAIIGWPRDANRRRQTLQLHVD